MTLDSTALHVRVWGAGNPERVICLHGANVPDAERIWQGQRPLAERYELLIVDRRGFGASPEAEQITFESELADIESLTESGAHLIGHSYGAVLSLLFATRHPEKVRSLIAIEPPAFGLALDEPLVAALAARLAPVHRAGPSLSPEEFLRGFVGAHGEELPADFTLSPERRKAINATRLAPDPALAPIDTELLMAAPFPRLIVSGQWTSEMEATCDCVARLIGAERVVIPGTGHSPHQDAATFNPRALALWASADA